jgi:3-oxoacyl-[acyl-carrier-protein] synthase-3
MKTLATIEDVAVSLPRRSISVEDSVTGFGLSRSQVRMLRRLHGFAELRDDPDQPLLDLLVGAARQVLRSAADPTRIKYLLYAHTVQTVTPSHVVLPDQIVASLGLTEAEPFAIGQQFCANSLSALDIVGELLRADGDPTARALLVTGEKRLPSLVSTLGLSTAIGEGAAACLIGLEGDGDRVLSYADRTSDLTRGSNWIVGQVFNDVMARYLDDLVDVAREALHRAGSDIGDIDMVVPHNVSLMLWKRTIEALGVDRRQVFLETVAPYGHCCCSDPFLNLMMLRRAGRLVAGRRYLLTSVGVGATHSAVVVEHQGRNG